MKGHGVGGEDGVKRGNGIDRPSQERHNEVDRRMKAVESDEILRRIAENQAYIKSLKERAQAWQIAQADPDQIALQMDDESLGGDEILETIPEEVPGQQVLASKLIAEV